MSRRPASRPPPVHQAGSGTDAPGSTTRLRLASRQTAEADGRHEGSDPAGATQPGSARLLGITSLAHFLNDGVVFFVPVIGDLLSQDHRTSTVMVTAMLTTFYVVSAGFGIVVGLVAVIRKILFELGSQQRLSTSTLGVYIGMVAVFVASLVAIELFGEGRRRGVPGGPGRGLH